LQILDSARKGLFRIAAIVPIDADESTSRESPTENRDTKETPFGEKKGRQWQAGDQSWYVIEALMVGHEDVASRIVNRATLRDFQSKTAASQ